MQARIYKGGNDMANCSKCNAELREGARFCTMCSARVDQSSNNFCTNPECPMCKKGFKFDSMEITCHMCGSATTTGQKVKRFI